MIHFDPLSIVAQPNTTLHVSLGYLSVFELSKNAPRDSSRHTPHHFKEIQRIHDTTQDKYDTKTYTLVETFRVTGGLTKHTHTTKSSDSIKRSLNAVR